MKKVFIIIVWYNGKEWLHRCLNSLRASIYPVSVYIIDNGSTDGSQEIIQEEYSEFYFIQSKENLGFGLANNEGIKYALNNDGDYVFLLNQDGWIDEYTVGLLIEECEKNTDFGIISPVHITGASDALDYQFVKNINYKDCPHIIDDLLLNKLRTLYWVNNVNAAA